MRKAVLFSSAHILIVRILRARRAPGRFFPIPRPYSFFSSRAAAWSILIARNFFTAHPLADIFHLPYPPIASQSISRDVPLTRARAF